MLNPPEMDEKEVETVKSGKKKTEISILKHTEGKTRGVGAKNGAVRLNKSETKKLKVKGNGKKINEHLEVH